VKLVWDESTWDDYVWWQQQGRKVLKRINTLIADIQRNGNEGIGKPEPLKHGLQGYWSRRITDEHRLLYKVIDDEIRIATWRYHYERLPKPYGAMRCYAQLHDVGMPARRPA
jgi:toxin YoeB